MNKFYEYFFVLFIYIAKIEYMDSIRLSKHNLVKKYINSKHPDVINYLGRIQSN